MKSDIQLPRHVLEELNCEPRINGAHVGVAVSEGMVTPY
jgi:hypothetical protein